MPRRRQSSPADEVDLDPRDRILERLAGVLERQEHVGELRRPIEGVRDRFKAPTFDGAGDVELFIQQFGEVSQANSWEDAAALLHLKESLKEGSRDCGQAGTLQGVETALRARYGLSTREARSRLTSLRRDSRTTLQEHAVAVEKLVHTAYADLPIEYRNTMLVDTFTSTIGNAYLQRHLLAVPTPTLELAVAAGNEYLQIQPVGNRGSGRPVVNMIEEEEEEGDEPAEAPTVKVATNKLSVDPLVEILKVLGALTEKIAQIQPAPQPVLGAAPPQGRRQAPRSGSANSQGQKCWGCGKEGHLRRDCQEVPWTATENRNQNQGNFHGPQQ